MSGRSDAPGRARQASVTFERMIRKILMQNYRGHERTEVPLEQFTLLVGDNGVGKTSTLGAPQFVDGVLRREITDLLEIVPGLVRSGATPPMALRLEGDSREGDWWLEVRTDDLTKNDAIEVRWWVANGGEYSVKVRDLGENKGLYKDFPPPLILEQFSPATPIELEFDKLEAASTSEEVQPRIAANGGGLATALLYLKVTDYERFLRFQVACRNVVLNLEEILFERVKQNRKRIEHVRVENELIEIPRTEPFIADGLMLRFKGTEPLPAYCASEGTLLTIGLLAHLYMPHGPRLILIDDLDKGLHPRAQAELAKAIRLVLKDRPDAQVVATTHSPYLVDAFSSDEVVVLSRQEGNGGVTARCLSSHPDRKLTKTLTTGEFLNSSGTDWFGL